MKIIQAFNSLKTGKLTKFSFLLLCLFFITFSSSFTKNEVVESNSVEELSCVTCIAYWGTFTTPGECTICILCDGADQRIEIENFDGSLIDFINPKANVEVCFNILSGRSVRLKQYGCPTQIPINLPSFACNN